ncbi:hypothetical protein GS592_25615 [Rhodococcus hoagii]|nr:hypothetical protein [Prescottella equi]
MRRRPCGACCGWTARRCCADAAGVLVGLVPAARSSPGSLGQGRRDARRIGTSIYERSQRNKLRKAAYALRTALDTSATAAERQAATETVKKLTDGLVKAPERVLSAVTAAIDTARRKELPVGLNQ